MIQRVRMGVNLNSNYDVLIVGAGPVGSIIAQQITENTDWKVLIIDKRNHIAGNCYDYYEKGVLIHKYGPHYFRTNNPELLNYLSRYTEWIEGKYFVKASYNGELYPLPINLDTLEQFYQVKLDEQKARDLLNEKRVYYEEPSNSEEFVLSRLGKDLYQAFYEGYTLKQWGVSAKELSPTVCGRVPIRFNRDHRYVDQKHQVIPKEGYTKMFEKIIDHPNIDVQLSVDFNDIKNKIKPNKCTVYTGPIDAFFDFKYGKLPWRSLAFDFCEYKEEYFQPCVQINYPNEFKFTRAVEIKHVTNQKCENTIVCYEYPKQDGDPYYPIPKPESRQLYMKYKKLADEIEAKDNVYFVGRLANYVYINMDQAMEIALRTAANICNNHNEQNHSKITA